MKRVVVLAMLVLSLLAFSVNLIFLVGDGMSANTILLASMLEGRILEIMKLPYTGLTITYSADSWVTDSAPAGTALFAGLKTLNRAINVLPNGEKVESLFKMAQKAGYATGIVVTCRVTHATPAAVYGAVSDRNDEVTLAKQLAEAGINVIFGGGRDMFLPTSKGGRRNDGLDLIEKMRSDGYTVITKKDELPNVKGDKVLGLFAMGHLKPVSERTEEPTLGEMTRKAIELLAASGKPFALMVEGSQIDWESHANDYYGIWKETVEFDEAVRVAIDFAKRDGNTLVVVIGDHETGGLSLSNGGYTINIEQARKGKGTARMFLRQFSINDKAKFAEGLKEWYGISITDAEYNYLRNVPSNQLERELARYISGKMGFGFTTYDHTAGVIPVYAFGPGAELFVGWMDNTEVAFKIMNIMKLKTISFPKVSAAAGY
uniref:Alkaline phosphatase n=1 Tax=Fervidobacterium thailandense TaxID=1008305 RepID=A0A7C4CCA1_9BACT